ncbi:MAG: MbcA/ParS/Xre antitoxin family protein [Paracoccaceae bacterium]|nr:DUF2384 domain-containing protein [Maritimibacter sp.]
MRLEALSENDTIAPKRLAAELHTTVEEVARTVGLRRESVSRKDRIATVRTQSRLREMVEILNRVAPRFGSDLMAYAWYRSQPVPGWGGRTPMALVQEGRAGAVMAYIDAIDAGGHA